MLDKILAAVLFVVACVWGGYCYQTLQNVQSWLGL